MAYSYFFKCIANHQTHITEPSLPIKRRVFQAPDSCEKIALPYKAKLAKQSKIIGRQKTDMTRD